MVAYPIIFIWKGCCNLRREIPDKNLFMMCKSLNKDALSKLSPEFHIRLCRKDELEIWKAIHFDDKKMAEQYYDFMTKYFLDVYSINEDLFYKKCLFVCDKNDVPIGTCFTWKAYEKITTLHWYKVVKSHEGKGIGRALLSIVMNDLKESDFPVFLHTQPASYRAVKLYTDFGFQFISNQIIGNRQNDLYECLPFLKEYMPKNDYEKLEIAEAPLYFLNTVASSQINEF